MNHHQFKVERILPQNDQLPPLPYHKNKVQIKYKYQILNENGGLQMNPTT